MTAFIALVKRELRAVARERTIGIAIVIQLFIASFSSALLIGLLSLYDPDSMGVYARVNLGIGFIGAPNNPLIGLLRDRDLRVLPFISVSEAQNAFGRNSVDAIVVAPEPVNGIGELQLYLPRAELRASLIWAVLQDPFKRYENVLRAQNGITVRYANLRGLPPTTFEYIYSVILPLLMFFPAFVAGSMVVDSLSEEIEHNTLETLLSAPVSLNTVVGSKISAALIVAALQCIAWLGLLRLNRIAVENTPLVLLLALIVAGIIATASAFIAVVFKNREQGQFIYSLFILLGTSGSYLLDASPLKTLTRLATGDYFTNGFSVLGFAATFLGMLAVLLVAVPRVQKAR
jgi:ABC-2 type transport system permease protein